MYFTITPLHKINDLSDFFHKVITGLWHIISRAVNINMLVIPQWLHTLAGKLGHAATVMAILL